MAIDDVRVRQVIIHTIAHATSNGDACCGQVRQAWRNLKAWRDQKPAPGAKANSLDLEVAAAENYMFARACVCDGFVSRFQMNTIAIGNYATKLVGVKMPTSGPYPRRLRVGRRASARRSWPRPSAVDSASHTAATGSAHSATTPSFRPIACRVSNTQP